MIKTALRFQNNMVVVFDGGGEQIPRYQGPYQEVRESILEDAPQDAVFGYFPDYASDFSAVPREEW